MMNILTVHSDQRSVWSSFRVSYAPNTSELLSPAAEASPSPRASATPGFSPEALCYHRTQEPLQKLLF